MCFGGVVSSIVWRWCGRVVWFRACPSVWVWWWGVLVWWCFGWFRVSAGWWRGCVCLAWWWRVWERFGGFGCSRVWPLPCFFGFVFCLVNNGLPWFGVVACVFVVSSWLLVVCLVCARVVLLCVRPPF